MRGSYVEVEGLRVEVAEDEAFIFSTEVCADAHVADDGAGDSG
jgi:hypothetical protein